MSDIAIIQKATLYEMADAIIDTTGRTESFKVSEMPTLIREDVYGKGKTDGYTEGYVAGNDAGYDEGIEVGKQAQYDEFWDTTQGYGSRTSYAYAFAYFNDALFFPKYDIVPTVNASYMFYMTNISTERFREVLEKIQIDISQLKSCAQVFSTLGQTKELPFDIDVSNATSTFDLFAWNSALKTIKKIIVSETTPIQTWFNADSSLENLTIEGTIGQNGLDLQWSTKLSKASITSVMEALTGSTGGLSVTLSLTAVNKAFETSSGANDGSTSAEWLLLYNNRRNWTINLV